MKKFWFKLRSWFLKDENILFLTVLAAEIIVVLFLTLRTISFTFFVM